MPSGQTQRDLTPAPSWATSSASTSRSAVRNGERPADTTTNGSAGTTSVHSAGRLASSPLSSKKKTRSDCQVLRRFTNSNERPDNGWNRCVTRTRSGYFPPATSHAVDDSVEQRNRARHPDGQAPRPRPGARRQSVPEDLSRSVDPGVAPLDYGERPATRRRDNVP